MNSPVKPQSRPFRAKLDDGIFSKMAAKIPSLGPIVVCLLGLIAIPLFGDSPHLFEPRHYNPPPDVPQSSFMYSVHIDTLQQKSRKRIPQWMEKRIHHELLPFDKRQITQRALNATYQQISQIMPAFTRYRFIKNRIYRLGPDPYGMDNFYRTLGRLADYPGIPDLPPVDFIVNQTDGTPIEYDPPYYWITPDTADQAPLFSYARRSDAHYVISIPDRFTIPGWYKVADEVLGANRATPWKEKIKAANWRGQTTDFCRHAIGAFSIDELAAHYSQKPRYQICALSQLYPNLIDAGFNAVHDGAPNLFAFVSSLMKPGLSIGAQIKYAYLPALDGYTSTYPGLLWRLLSNSVVLKQESPNSQWFYDALIPYVHYIPIAEHMEDLVKKIEWAQNHPTECQQISQAAQHFVLQNLMTEDLYLYMFIVLQEYAKRQNFSANDLETETVNNPQWLRIR